jgi:hypothetical protein
VADKDICERLYEDTLAIEPTDGTVEAREYGLEIARKSLNWLEDNSCGLDVDPVSVDFVCPKRFPCPLRNIVKVSI